MRLLATFLIALTLSLPGFAVELTDKNVQKWVQSYSAITALSKTQDKKELEFLEQEQTKNPQFDALFTNALKSMKNHKLYGEFTGVLKQNGFSDSNEWAQLGDRIMAATMAVEMDKHQATSGQTQAQAQMKQAMSAVMNNPNMTAEQKAQMQQMMGMGTQMMSVADKVPAADKAVIKRNADLIKKTMDQASAESQN